MSLIKNYLLSLARNAVRDKFTFDKHNEHYERIYRLEGDFYINEKQDLTAVVQIPLGPTLKDEYPEIVEQVRILPRRDLYFERDEDTFKEDSVMWADSTVFKIFTIPFKAGDPERFYGKQVITAEDNNGEMQEKAFNNFFANYDYMDVIKPMHLW